jgi:tetratricopeptide (TPR) repeat protein
MRSAPQGPRLVRCAFVLLALVGPSAHADPAGDATARARSHFEAGKALYELGRFSEAQVEFAAGYELSKEPRLLVNLGQCYRKLNQLAKAREIYQRYLDTSGDDEYRVQVKKVIAELDRQLAAMPPAPEKRPAAPVEVAKPSPPPPVAHPAQLDLQRPPPPPVEHKSFARRNWWIFPVVALLAAGAGVGLYFLVRPVPPDCGAASFGCLYPPGP